MPAKGVHRMSYPEHVSPQANDGNHLAVRALVAGAGHHSKVNT
jgi:hypothetical protein